MVREPANDSAWGSGVLPKIWILSSTFLYMRPSRVLERNSIFEDYFFQRRFRFRAKYRDFPNAPAPTRAPASPIINITSQSGTFVKTDDPTRTHDHHPKPIAYLRVHCWCYAFHEFGHMYKDTYPPSWYHTRCFHCPKSLCVLPIAYLSLPTPPTPQTLAFPPPATTPLC